MDGAAAVDANRVLAMAEGKGARQAQGQATTDRFEKAAAVCLQGRGYTVP